MAESRTVGVEEEMLLVERESGRAMSMQGQVLAEFAERRAAQEGHAGASGGDENGEPAPGSGDRPEDSGADTPGGEIEGELNREQIEVGSTPHSDLERLGEELHRWRLRASVAARRLGAGVAALGLCPTPVTPHRKDDERYDRISERFGITAEEQLSSGCHVHVAVADRAEAVAVIDRVRVWLPLLTGLSANSPFWQGRDTAYASYRSLVMDRWPSAGPTEVFGSVEAYEGLVADMLATGVLLDEGMVYFDARASHRYPTVEIRVADVCLDVRDTVLVAALCRALVDHAVEEAAAGEPIPDVPASLLRMARWQAARHGLEGDLVHPETFRPVPAWEALDLLAGRLQPMLRAHGDEELVEEGFARLRERGTGARRQRSILARTGKLEDVVADAVRVTAGMGD